MPTTRLLRRVGRMVRGLVHLGPRNATRVVAAWVLLGLSRFAILVLPFSLVRRALGERRDVGSTGPVAGLDDATSVRAARIAATVALAPGTRPGAPSATPRR